MQSSDTATGVRVNCLYHIFSQRWNARKKQTSLAFNFEEDPSYFVILLYKLRNFIKIYDCYVNDPIKGIFRRLWCMIKIFRGGGEGVVDGVGGSSDRCLKWGGGGSLRDLSKNILK